MEFEYFWCSALEDQCANKATWLPNFLIGDEDNYVNVTQTRGVVKDAARNAWNPLFRSNENQWAEAWENKKKNVLKIKSYTSMTFSRTLPCTGQVQIVLKAWKYRVDIDTVQALTDREQKHDRLQRPGLWVNAKLGKYKIICNISSVTNEMLYA